jgi:SAM-dependent methyltransferase
MKVSSLTQILDYPSVYAMWQGPFAKQKTRPLFDQNILENSKRILDVGCGPGTNSSLFEGKEHIGIDLNPLYVEYAQSKFPGKFICGDAVTFSYESLGTFDLIFLNSLMHHLPEEACRILLNKLIKHLTPGGRLVVLDLIIDKSSPLAFILAKLDRGKFVKTVDHWQNILTDTIRPNFFKRYDVGIGPLPLWKMFMAVGQS